MILWHHLIQLHVLVYLLHRGLSFNGNFNILLNLLSYNHQYFIPNLLTCTGTVPFWFTVKVMEGTGTVPSLTNGPKGSVLDHWHFGTDLDPRIRTMTYGSGSCFFRQCLIRCQQTISFLAYYFLKVHWQQSSKIQSQLVEIMFFLSFLHIDGRIRIRKNTNDPDPGGPKNTDLTDPDHIAAKKQCF